MVLQVILAVASSPQSPVIEIPVHALTTGPFGPVGMAGSARWRTEVRPAAELRSDVFSCAFSFDKKSARESGLVIVLEGNLYKLPFSCIFTPLVVRGGSAGDGRHKN